MSERYPLEPLQRVRHAGRERAQLVLAQAAERAAAASTQLREAEQALLAHQGAAPQPTRATLHGAALQREAAFCLRHTARAQGLRARVDAARAALQAAQHEVAAAQRALQLAAGAQQVLDRDRERFDREALRTRERKEERELEERQQTLRHGSRSS